MYSNKKHEEAIVLLKNGKPEEALILLNYCLEEDPHNPVLLCERGTVFLHLNKKKESLADMNKAVELDPEYSYRYSSRAYVRDFFGDTEGAITDYEIAVKLDPEDAVALNNLGLLMEKLGYMEAAKRNFAQADSLVRNEPSLKQRFSELEDGEPVNHPEGVELQPRKQETNEHNRNTPSLLKTMLGVFTSKKGFSEFMNFLRNGFKINENDESGKS